MTQILTVDDNKPIRKGILKFLEKLGHQASAARNGVEALELLRNGKFDLVISDIKMPEMDGIELLRVINEEFALPVIMLTGHGSVESAVEAMKIGADDFLPKPVQFEELEVRIERALKGSELAQENARLKSELARETGGNSIIGNSRVMEEVKQRLKLLARDGQISVLIKGETGTGKELAARYLHDYGPRVEGLFVAINCSALPLNLAESELFGHVAGAFTDAKKEKSGLFERADGGTLFLDEIDSLDLTVQAKVLRAIESGVVRKVGGEVDVKVDVRFVSATGRDLQSLVSDAEFRKDLYYRIAVAEVEMPSLKKRTSDVPLLVDHFCRLFGEQRGREISFSEEAIKYMCGLRWEGNVRELKNLVEICGVTAAAEVVEMKDVKANLKVNTSGQPELPDDLKAASKTVVEKFERDFIKQKLELNQFNVSKTAEQIGLSRTALHQKIKNYELDG